MRLPLAIITLLLLPFYTNAQTSFGQWEQIQSGTSSLNLDAKSGIQQPDSLEYKRFYLRTESFLSILIPFFSKNAYYTDLQFGYAITQNIHFNAGISRAKTYRFSESVAQNDSNVLGELELKGLAKLGYSAEVRYFPFRPFEESTSAWDYFFVGLGAFYTPYTGSTYEHAFNTLTGQYEYQFLHQIEINRYGPKLELGFCLRDLPSEFYDSDARFFFSPEILVGARNVHLNVLKDEVDQMHGSNEFDPYSEKPLRFYVRGRIGVAF